MLVGFVVNIAIRIKDRYYSSEQKTKNYENVNFAQNLLRCSDRTICIFAYKLTANREEANDLLQETSLKALDNEEKYIAETNFKGWIYTIMRNIFINNYRKSLRDQTYVDQTDNQFYLNQGSGIGS